MEEGQIQNLRTRFNVGEIGRFLVVLGHAHVHACPPQLQDRVAEQLLEVTPPQVDDLDPVHGKFIATSWTATLPMLADEVEEVGKAFAARWRPCA